MLTFVLGPSGSGKTKYLIQQANEELKAGNGNIVFIDSDDNHIFTLDHAIRLIEATDFQIDSLEKLYGFLSGIAASNFDITKMYIDGIYKVINVKDTIDKLVDQLAFLSETADVDLLFGLDLKAEEIPVKQGVEIVALSKNED